jgi:hypothetical protein
MAYELSSSVKYVNPILGFYTEGPWTSVSDANANIAPAIRVQGMACKIIIAGVAHIYWYRDGILDTDLVEFTSGVSTFSDLTDSPYDNTQLAAALSEFLRGFNVSYISPVNIDLSTANENTLVDGFPIGVNYVLLPVQDNTSENGIYTTYANGSLTFPFRSWVKITSYFIDTSNFARTLFFATFGNVNTGAIYNAYSWIGTNEYLFRKLGGGGTTQSSQAQVEAAFDNTDQTTPVVLEQTSALTPFNAWWLVQKIKAFFSTTANQTDSTNKRFVTDAEKVVIGNTSNTNSGDETTATIQTKRPLKTINTQSLEGTGDLTVTSFTAASVAEVNTGSDNTKGATPLNLETSKYLTQNGTKTYATTGGTSTAYTVTLSPAITAYATGSQFNLVAHTSNTTTTPTINFNGLGAKNIVDRFGNAIGVGGFQGNLIVRYNGTSFNIIGAVTTMAANTIKGNNTGSTANASDLTTDQFTAMMEIAVAVGTTGIITAMTSATYKYIRLTSASATGLGSIIAPSSSYKDLYIWNDTGVILTLYHDYSSEATAANRILCGANRSWANNIMLHLKYDVVESRWCTVAQDGNTFRALLAGTGTRLVEASSTGQEQAIITTLDIDFSGAQQTAATSATWTGVNEVNIAGLLQGQLYIDYATTGYRYECHRNDWCSRTPVINVEVFTTNSLYPILEQTSNFTLFEDQAYVVDSASLVTMSLPSTGTLGKVIVVNGKGAGGWKVTVPNTQQIVGGLTNSTTAGSGYIEATGATKQYAAVTLKCIVGGTAAKWAIVSTNPATTLTIA